MIIRQLLILLFLGAAVSVYAQTWDIAWEKHPGAGSTDLFARVTEGSDGSLWVLGAQGSSISNLDFWLVKFSSTGELEWQNSYSREGNDMPEDVVVLRDGGCLMSGSTTVSGKASRALLIRTDSMGNEIWQKTPGDEAYRTAENVVELNSGVYVISGSKVDSESKVNLFISGTGSEGEILWEQNINTFEKAAVRAMKKLPDGGFILAAGVSRNAAIQNSNVYVARYNPEGEKLWDKELDTPDKNVWPECVCCSPDSQLVVIGWHGNCMNDITSEDPVFDYDLYLATLSPAGKLIWEKNIDSEGSEGGNAVAVRPNGQILLAGKKETSFLGRIGPWLMLSDNNGQVLGELVLPFGFNGDQVADIINTKDNGFAIVGPGKIDSRFKRSKGWIRKFNSF